MTDLKVLIIDNEEDDFETIKRSLIQKLDANFLIYPEVNNSTDKSLNNWGYLIQELRLKKFAEVMEHYKNIDLFIIDISLIKDTDNLGEQFGDFIRKELTYPHKTIFLSNLEMINQEKLINGSEYFISKAQELSYSDALAERLSKIFNITFKPEQKGRWMSKLSDKIKKNIARAAFLIDKLILVIFFILLIITSVSGGWHIYQEFMSAMHLWNANATQADDSRILEHAEHIFLYLLPVFIVFGFFVYYRTNIQNTFMGGFLPTSEGKPPDFSTRTMNLTKIMFIASLISYILIKTIEVVFDDEFHLGKLLAAGSLLLLLMTYYILLDRKQH